MEYALLDRHTNRILFSAGQIEGRIGLPIPEIEKYVGLRLLCGGGTADAEDNEQTCPYRTNDCLHCLKYISSIRIMAFLDPL